MTAHTAQPIVQVVVQSPLPHLDQEYDYLVPESLAGQVQLGTRVKVKFHGRLLTGYVVNVKATSEFSGKLAELVAAEVLPVLSAEMIKICRQLARYYCVNLVDFLKLTAPAAPVKSAQQFAAWLQEQTVPDGSVTSDLRAHQTSLINAAADQAAELCRTTSYDLDQFAALVAAPGSKALVLPEGPEVGHLPVRLLAYAALRAAQVDKQVIIAVPDGRSVKQLTKLLQQLGLHEFGGQSGSFKGDYSVVNHQAGQSGRYLAAQAGRLGLVPLIIGTRQAVLQATTRPTEIIFWEPDSNLFSAERTPHFQALTVAGLRAHYGVDTNVTTYTRVPGLISAGMFASGFMYAQELPALASRPVQILDSQARQKFGPAGWHWLPPPAWRLLQSKHQTAVVVPRRGYVNALACARCETWATCRACGFILKLVESMSDPHCDNCAAFQPHHHCVECQSPHLKQLAQGAGGIAAQLRRMLPQEVVESSSTAGILSDRVRPAHQVVVATPGALPQINLGYDAIVLLNAPAAIAPEWGGEIRAVRRGLELLNHLSPDGELVIVGDLPPLITKTLVRRAGLDFIRTLYQQAVELSLPPVTRHLTLRGSARVLAGINFQNRSLHTHPDLNYSIGAAPNRAESNWYESGRSEATPDMEQEASVLVPRKLFSQLVTHLRDYQVACSKKGDSLYVRVDMPLE